jgi:hypothetical protein
MLDYTGSSPTYIHSAWITSTAYALNAMVRYEIQSGVWRDYRCKQAHTSSSANAPGTVVNSWFWDWLGLPGPTYWEDQGLSATSGGYTYVTNVRSSAYPAWTSGAAVVAGQAVWDQADNRDYQATVALTAGENTGEGVRPSNAIGSVTESIAARWVLVGASNAWAMLDYQLDSRLQGYTSAGALVDPVFDLRLGPNNVNLVAAPYDFSTGWAATGGTLATNQRNGADGSSNTADDFTGNAADGYLQRAFTSLAEGVNVTFGLWLLTTDAEALSSVAITLRNSSDVVLATTTCALTTSWAYFEVTAAVPTGGEIRARIGGTTVSTGNEFAAWGAHVGYAGAIIDRVCLAGMVNAGSVTAAILVDGAAFDSVTQSLVPSGVTHGVTHRSANLEVGPITAHNGVVLRITLVRQAKAAPVQVGVVAVGKAAELMNTEWGVETSLLSFSRKERDEVFGGTQLMKRGNSLQTRATGFIDTAVISGDVVMSFLRAFDGVAVFFDFNNRQDSAPTEFDNMRTFGFSTRVSQTIPALSWQSFTVDVEGLVE